MSHVLQQVFGFARRSAINPAVIAVVALAALLIAVPLTAGPNAVAQTAEPTVTIEPSSTTLQPGQTGFVHIKFANSTDQTLTDVRPTVYADPAVTLRLYESSTPGDATPTASNTLGATPEIPGPGDAPPEVADPSGATPEAPEAAATPPTGAEQTIVLPPGGEKIWTLTIAAPDLGAGSITVWVQIDYVAVSQDETARTPRAALTSFTVENGSLQTLKDGLTIAIEAPEKLTIDAERTGWFTLILTNTLDIPVEVNGINCRYPQNVVRACQPIPHAELESGSDPRKDTTKCSVPSPSERRFTIEARSLRAVYFCVEASDQLRPGTQLLSFEISYSGVISGQRSTVTDVSTHEIAFGVFGSEVLELVGIPSLILLPGILALLMFFVVWQWHTGSAKAFSIPEKARDPKFWVAAITLSFIALLPYAWITSKLASVLPFVTSRGKIENGYGYIDIIYLWFGSIIASLILSTLLVIAIREYRHQRNYWRAQRTFTLDDDPLTVLARLRRLGSRTHLAQYRIDASDNAPLGYRLGTETDEDGNELALLYPQIELEWIDNTEASRDFRASAQSLIEQPDTRAKKLEKLVAEGAREGKLVLSWANYGGFERPIARPRAEVGKPEPPSSIVQLK